MAAQPKLVNKQFNTPIGLYSQQNVQEVLQREQQMLSNGAIGIDFNNPNVGKPSNLQNSAVLRMLEEEENRRGGRAGNGDYYPTTVKDVPWPPPQHDQLNHIRSSFKDVVIPGVKRVAWPPPQEGVLDPAEVVEHSAVQSQGGPQNSNPGLPQNSYSPQRVAPYQQTSQPAYRPLKPLDISSVGTGSPLASPALYQSPQAYRPATPVKGWAPVQSPVQTPIGPGPQKYFGAPAQGYQNQPQYQAVSPPFQQANQGYQEPGRQYTLPAQQASPQSYQQTGQQYGQSTQQFQKPGNQYQQQAPHSWQEPGTQYGRPAQQYQPPAQQYQQPNQYQQPGQYQQPSQYQQPGQYQQPNQQSNQFQQPNQYQQPPQQYQASQFQPQAEPASQFQPQSQPASQFQPQSQPAPQQYQAQSFAQPQNQSVAAQAQAAPRPQPAKQVEPPPSTITLRPSAPVSQAPAPVYNAQPATATLKGGKHLRGDLKWPPENVRQRMAEDKQHEEDLEKGPANRPSKREKDYSRFFAEHALNSAYPGYKIPPGTQFFRPE